MSKQKENRATFLAALRSGEFTKGEFIKGGDAPPNAQGYCAVGLPYTLFLNNEGPVAAGLKRVLGLKQADISKIQNEWNDSDMSFAQIADKIETEIFNDSQAEATA